MLWVVRRKRGQFVRESNYSGYFRTLPKVETVTPTTVEDVEEGQLFVPTSDTTTMTYLE